MQKEPVHYLNKSKMEDENVADIYLSSTLMWNASLEDMFQKIYENNLDGIELWAQHMAVRGFSADEYCRLEALYPVKTFIHSYSWDLNLSSINEGIRQASVNEVKKAVDLASILGSYEVTVHPGRMSIPWNKQQYAIYFRESLDQILEYAKPRQVDISLEIMETIPKEFVTSMEKMREALGDLYQEFYYTLDIAHCDSEQEIFDTLMTETRLSKLHISNRKGKLLHTSLDDGDYSFKDMFPKLKPYQIPAVIEGFDSEKNMPILEKTLDFLKENGGLLK